MVWQLLKIPLHYLQIEAFRTVWPLQFLQQRDAIERLTAIRRSDWHKIFD